MTELAGIGLLVHPKDPEQGLLQLTLVDPDATAPKLPAVQDQVVVAGPDLQRLTFKFCRILLNRRGKGVVRRMDLPTIHLKEREILNPTESQFTFINEIQLGSEVQAQGPKARRGYLPGAGNNQHQVANRSAKGGSQTRNLSLAQKLCYWGTKTIFGNGNPH